MLEATAGRASAKDVPQPLQRHLVWLQRRPQGAAVALPRRHDLVLDFPPPRRLAGLGTTCTGGAGGRRNARPWEQIKCQRSQAQVKATAGRPAASAVAAAAAAAAAAAELCNPTIPANRLPSPKPCRCPDVKAGRVRHRNSPAGVPWGAGRATGWSAIVSSWVPRTTQSMAAQLLSTRQHQRTKAGRYQAAAQQVLAAGAQCGAAGSAA